MAYGEKYYHEFCDTLGRSCKISILKDDYTGVSTELEGQPNPITIGYDNSDEFKFKGIIPSTAEIGLVFGTDNGVDFSEFWESDEKTFKIEYYVDSIIEWLGFVLIDGFAYNLTGGAYYAQITAVDGLSTLDSIIFQDDNTNKPYGLNDLTYNNGFEFPFILIATEILRKLDLDIDLWSLIDVYEQTQLDRTSLSRDSDPLAQTYVNVTTYINDTKRSDIPYFEDVNEAWNCEKVMTNLLSIWGAKLYQSRGVWKIKRENVDSKYNIENPFLVSGSDYLHQSSYTDGTGQSTVDKDEWVYDSAFDLYSLDASLIIGSVVENKLGSGLAVDGFYKLKGVGSIVEVGGQVVQAITIYTPPVYRWHKYNTLSGYVGSELIDDSKTITCNDNNNYLLGNDHLLRADDIYKQFRVNYEYTYLRDGDSPINLLKNGNFEEDYTQYGDIESPPSWGRVIWGAGNWYARLFTDNIPIPERPEANRNKKMLVMGDQYNNLNSEGKTWASYNINALRQNDISVSNTKDEAQLTIYTKYRHKVGKSRMFPVIRVFLVSDNACYFLLNNNTRDTLSPGDYNTRWSGEYRTNLAKKYSDGSVDLKYTNTESYRKNFNTSESSFLALNSWEAENYPKKQKDETIEEFYARRLIFEENDNWYQYKLSIPTFKASGQLAVYIHGLATDVLQFFTYEKKQLFKIVRQKTTSTARLYSNLGYFNQPRLKIASINIGYVSAESEEIPSEDYIYANENINFSDQRDPIEIFNGDTESPTITSSLIVPTNTGIDRNKKNKWDTSDHEYGRSDLGLILCKSIMSQYGTPSRLLEGDVKAENVEYGTRFKFDAIPNILWILLRGKFNPMRGYIEGATFAQISNNAIRRGGIINGESLDPNWVYTGNSRCIQDDGVNTGYYEEEEEDINPNSETFGAFRWIIRDIDTSFCPIGDPIKYYWGTDEAAYQLSNFKSYTVLSDENNVVSVNYTQDGGEYIYFLHLSSLGTVNRVANGFQYNIVDSFQYLADITINGYIYRVFRQDFKTSIMNNFTQIFDFN